MEAVKKAQKSTKSESLAEALTSLGNDLELVDYDGAPLGEPRRLTLTHEIDATTCLFPFPVDVDVSASFPLGKRYVPCGHCEDCLRRRRNQWFFRIKQEAKSHLLNLFVTLTYSDENLCYDEKGNPCVFIEEIQLFLKRLRKKIEPNRIRYFGISEYGPQTNRPHYHIILFNWPYEYDSYSLLIDAWGCADNITISALCDEQIMYLSRYHTDKGFTPDGYAPTFTFMSRNPGIGHCYATDPDNIAYHLADPQRAIAAPLEDNRTTSLGRYLRNKIYGKDFECPRPDGYTDEPTPRDERYKRYYAKKAKRRAKLDGKI